MKALVLAGGTGKRLRPLTNTTTKQLLPIANRPILHYILDMVSVTGIEQVGITTAPEWHDQVRDTLGDGRHWGLSLHYLVQEKPAGLADAVTVAGKYLGDEPFLMVLGDNIYKFEIGAFMQHYAEEHPDTLLLLGEVSNPARYGIADMPRGDTVIGVEEKPAIPRSNLALAGVYAFSPLIHDVIYGIKPSPRGELEITDAIQRLIEKGGKARGHRLEGWWLDTGNLEDMLAANQAVMDELMAESRSAEITGDNIICGKIHVESGVQIANSTINGPVSIGRDCKIIGSSIGPYTSLGPGSTVNNAILEFSIIMAGASINDTRVKGSIVGAGCSCHDKTYIYHTILC
ncbi:glucose-1-phosphate thymidylyltransferase [Chloroflexota bacterium]